MNANIETAPVVTIEAPQPWHKAYHLLIELGLTSGLRGSSAQLYEAMGIPRTPARKEGENDARFAKRSQLWSLTEYHPQFKQLCAHLLEQHGFWLRMCGKYNSEWEIRNGDGAKLVERSALKDVRKSLKDAQHVLSHMATDGLTDTQRAQHSDSIARMTYIDSMFEVTNKVKIPKQG